MTLISQPIFFLIFIPLIGVFVILFTNNDYVKNEVKKSKFSQLIATKNSDSILYNIALIFSLLNLLISIVMWYFFNTNLSKIFKDFSLYGDNSYKVVPTFEFETNFQFIFEVNHFSFGVDGISIFFVLLTTFITPIAIFSSYELYTSTKTINSSQTTVKNPAEQNKDFDTNNLIVNKEQKDSIKIKIFLISLLLLESLQICAFVSLDLLLFYVFFESVLPILFILIVVFGHGENRFRSAFLLFLYTLAGSLPMLLSILTIYSYLDSTDYQLISFNEISLESQK